ncbi:hypothetical protein HGB07_04745 [Candidatus Roizmanbacteria bacterium]|nr:hypothetical protein [Candidatus Roizmanbacteria bacterium]
MHYTYVLNREALRWAAATHDLRREDDPEDIEYGRRAAGWIAENLGDKTPSESMSQTQYLASWHVPDDVYAPVVNTSLMVLKDADGLDRWRLGTTNLNPATLRFPSSQLLVAPARMLYELSTRLHGKTKRDPFVCVLEAGVTLGLVTYL